MSFIDITTNNLSREFRNAATFIDNWAYVPGTAITGDYTKVYAFTSLDEFKNTCGTKGPEGSPTFNYVAGLLNSGIPVLFRRIACRNQDQEGEQRGVIPAFHIFTTAGQDPINLLRIEEKFGGTFGNDINVSLRITTTAYWLEVYLKSTLLEKHKLFRIPAFDPETSASDRQLEINQLLIDTLSDPMFNSSLERINVTVLNTVASEFNLPEFKNQYLHDGEDFNENDVRAALPATYNFIKDKILYQPKFITSGGYTDLNMTESKEIATAK